jgi:type IV pilus assembly protein PilC
LRQLLAKRSSWLALSSARRTQSVLVYSGFMMLFLLATLSILLFYVYPTFKDVFIGFGSRLPPLTRFYVWLSDFIRENLIAVAVLSALAIYGLRYTARRRPILAQHCLLLVPGVGALIESEKMSRSLAVVGTLIDAGMPLPEALAQAAPVAGPYLGLGLRRAAESIRQGSDAAASLAQQPELPALLRWYFQVAGERDVTLVLAEAAEVFEQRFKVYMENVPQILEMAFILAVGGIMGTGVVALFMPMFDMGG